MRVPNPWILLPLTGILIGILIATQRPPAAGPEVLAQGGLPAVAEYGSLLVDGERFLLGSERGVFLTRDEGASWGLAGLDGRNFSALAQTKGGIVWAGGPDGLARSDDGGETWREVRPGGLPRRLVVESVGAGAAGLYVFVEVVGLFRSGDEGMRFRRVGKLGGSVRAFAVGRGDLWAAERLRGVLLRSGNAGRAWHAALDGDFNAVAVDPSAGRRVLAAGDQLRLSADSGESWREVLSVSGGIAAAAFAQGDSPNAYVVAFDGQLYRSDDDGETWEIAG